MTPTPSEPTEDVAPADEIAARTGVELLTLLHPVLDHNRKQRKVFRSDRANFVIAVREGVPWMRITEIQSDAVHAKIVESQRQRALLQMPPEPVPVGTRITVWTVPVGWCSFSQAVTVEEPSRIERPQLVLPPGAKS